MGAPLVCCHQFGNPHYICAMAGMRLGLPQPVSEGVWEFLMVSWVLVEPWSVVASGQQLPRACNVISNCYTAEEDTGAGQRTLFTAENLVGPLASFVHSLPTPSAEQPGTALTSP
jgi:hypothetical protein